MQCIVYLECELVIVEVWWLFFVYDWVEYLMILLEQVVEWLIGVMIVIINKVFLLVVVVYVFLELKMVVVVVIGINIVDFDVCKVCGIVVSNICGYVEYIVLEYVMVLVFVFLCNLVVWWEIMQVGCWQQFDQFCLFDYLICDLYGVMFGLIGSGSLGNGVVWLVEVFGMCVLCVERKGEVMLCFGYIVFE